MQTRAIVTATLLALSMNISANDTRLTIYSGDFDTIAATYPGAGTPGFALVRQALEFDLRDGDNTLTLSGLPAAIDASGVQLVPASKSVAIASQRFDFALADQSELLRRSVGQRVTVEQAVGDSRQTFTGTLLAAGDGLSLALDDGRVRVLSSYTGFELASLPDGLYARPTLRWGVTAAKAGKQAFALDYPTGGLAWRAEYLATLSGDGDKCRMDFRGAAQILNRSGTAFTDAAVTLVAGAPNIQRGPQPQMMMMRSMDAVGNSMAPPSPESQPSGEYHAYTLPQHVDLPESSIQRVPLVADAANVACTRRYESRSPMGTFRASSPIVQPDFGTTGEQPVMAMLEFFNRRDAGLGMPLPAGRLRVFERGEDDAEDFLGEAMIDHTAYAREVKAALGQVFDLSVERTRDSFELAKDRRSLTEGVSLKVRNAKPAAATVRIIELLPRWSDWEVVDASTKWTRVDAQTIAFDVPVPAESEATVRYTVRYRWPEAITP
jgi:hypothetical protein